MTQRFDRIARSIAINTALAVPVARRLVTRTHVTGIDGNEEQARLLFDFYSLAEPVRDRVVAELGPGKTLETLEMARAAGAAYVVGLDIVRYHDDLVARRRGIDYRLFDGNSIPLADASVDVVWACYCMQHFRDPAQMVGEIVRILKPGGSLVCRVDLRDHYSMHETGREYECLSYSKELWRLMAWNRSSYVNRLRFSQWLTLLASAGLSAANVVRHQNGELVLNNRNHAYLADLSDEDVSTYRFDGVFRRSSV